MRRGVRWCAATLVVRRLPGSLERSCCAAMSSRSMRCHRSAVLELENISRTGIHPNAPLSHLHSLALATVHRAAYRIDASPVVRASRRPPGSLRCSPPARRRASGEHRRGAPWAACRRYGVRSREARSGSVVEASGRSQRQGRVSAGPFACARQVHIAARGNVYLAGGSE